MRTSSLEGTSLHVRNSNGKWIIFIFLLMVFFIANHNINYNCMETMSKGTEWTVTVLEEGSLKHRLPLLCLGVFAIVILMFAKRSLSPVAKISNWPMILFILWIILSIFWAYDSAFTLRRVIRFLLPCFGAFAIAKRFTFRDIVQLAFLGSLVYIIIGFMIELVHGNFAPFDIEYRFSGTRHPNHQAWHCSMLLFSAIFIMRREKRKSVFYHTIAIVSMIFLILTKSRSAFTFTLLALFIYWVLTSYKSQKFVLILVVGFVFFLLLLLVGDNLFSLLQHGFLLGREEGKYTFSNRIPVWEDSISYITQRPLLGYGFNSFWTTDHILTMIYSFSSAHSDYVDLLLGVGVVGLGIFLGILCLTLVRYVQAYRTTNNPSVAFGITMLLFYCFTMTAEVIGFSTSLFTFIVYVLFFKDPRSLARQNKFGS